VNQIPKPPVGLIPLYIWDDMRYTDILAAIERYKEANIEIPDEWLDEMKAINARRK